MVKNQKSLLNLPPISLYVHIPWCIKKCPYCDFNSHEVKKRIPSKEYVRFLILDLENNLDQLQGRKFQSVFLGGGTPSIFPMSELSIFFDYLFKKNIVQNRAEITLEVNPFTIKSNIFNEYENIGINRVSIGIQSFQDDKLQKIGRIHDKKSTNNTINYLKSSKIKNFNIDLMYGLPDQTLEDAVFDLSSAVNLSPTHISWYQLTIEKNTAFAINPPKNLPSDKNLNDIENYAEEFLEKKFSRYEISAYSQNLHSKSKHNLNYWKFGDYIGIGAGAHSKITDLNTKKIIRFWNRKNPIFYMQEKGFIYSSKQISESEIVYEFMLNALRLTDGFKKNLFEERTGKKFETILEKIKKLQEKGLLIIDKQRILPTRMGRNFLNEVIQVFMD